MEEKLYKKMKSVGVSNLVFGIVTIAFGIGAGVMMIVNGARLLAQIYYFKCIYCLIYYCNALTECCNGMSGILYCVERDYE